MSSAIFKKSVTNFYLLLFLISLSIASIIVDLNYPSTNFTRTMVNDFIISPIQYVVKTPSNFFYGLLEETETIAQLKSKIESLEKVYSREIQMRKTLVTDPKEIRDSIDKKLKSKLRSKKSLKFDKHTFLRKNLYSK